MTRLMKKSGMAITDDTTRRFSFRRKGFQLPSDEDPSSSHGADIESILGSREMVSEFADEPPPWLEQVIPQFVAISSLPANWDNYGARAPDEDILESALRLLGGLSAKNLAFPLPRYINPTRDGGIQFEWESGGRYFEIEVRGPGEAVYYFEDESDGTCEEGHISEGKLPACLLRYIELTAEGQIDF